MLPHKQPQVSAVQLPQNTVGVTLSSCCPSPPTAFTATSSRCHSTAKLCNTHLNMVLVRPGGLRAKELSSKSTSDRYREVFPPDPFWGIAGVCFKTSASCLVCIVLFFLPTKYTLSSTHFWSQVCVYLLVQSAHNQTQIKRQSGKETDRNLFAEGWNFPPKKDKKNKKNTARQMFQTQKSLYICVFAPSGTMGGFRSLSR